MPLPTNVLLRRLLLFCTLLASLSARAQYTPADTARAWSAYNSAFLFTDSGGNHVFGDAQGNSTSPGFWKEANEIAMADDAYTWAVLNDHANLSNYVAEINSLCAGFVDAHGHDWSSDAFNDDLNWATIAFIRAYTITGTSSQLADAITNYNTVWSRAQSPAGSGNGLAGLIQIQPPHVANLDSPVNFTFVIAGNLLTAATGVNAYKAEADNVYTWSMANLYQPTVNNGVCNGHTSLTCSKIYDGNSVSVGGTTGPTDYTYDYGIAIEAIVLEGNYAVAQNVANWLMFDFNGTTYPYAGTYPLNGTAYNVLPNYLQGGVNDAGYDGIAIRGVSYGLAKGALNGSTLAWAQANASAVWSVMNASGLSWNAWNLQTPASGLYSWDASASMATLLLVPSSSVAVSGPTSAYEGLSATFTAIVTPTVTATAATGTVQFYANGAAIGSAVAVTNDAASLPYTFTSAGTEAITAVYSGDANYTASTSQPVSVTVNATAFSVKASPATLSFTSGASSGNSVVATVSSVNSFAGIVAFSCSLSGSTATVQPTCSASPLSGSLAANGTLTSTILIYSAVKSSSVVWLRWPGVMLAVGFFALRRRKRAGALLAVVMMAGVVGCGGNSSGGTTSSGPVQTSAGNYTLTVTAMSGSLTESSTVAVTIN